MGLFNHLFGGKKGLAKELVLDEKKRLALWKEHLDNFSEREELSKNFNFKTVDQAIEKALETIEVLTKIEALINPDFINIGEEEKLEEEIIADLSKLREVDLQSIVEEKKKQELLLELFLEIHDTLIVELHLLRLIKKKLSREKKDKEKIKDLLLKLFRLVFNKEAMLYKLFWEESYFKENLPQHKIITKIARKVILEEKLEEEIETEEDIFAKEMFEKMAELKDIDESKEESKHDYHKLGEGIFFALTGKVGAPRSSGEDLTIAIAKMESTIKNDAGMYKIIKKLRPKYSDTKIKAAIRAFRKAYDNLHFEHLMGEFAT